MPRGRIGLADVKLLVDVAYASETAQVEFLVSEGFGAAGDRLVSVGLLERNPTTRIRNVVRITDEGMDMVARFIFDLESQ